MESLADRTRRVLRGHEGPVAPLSTLVRLLRADGCAVTEWVLLRALKADAGFRLLHPWRGSLEFLVETDPGGRVRRGPGEPDPRHVLVLVDLQPTPEAARPSRPRNRDLAGRLRRSLLVLGRALDERSVLDRIRWLRMLSEAGVLRSS